MSENDPFFERLRADARPLRHEPDEFALARIRVNIRSRLERPTVAQLLAAWFRPVLATVALLASVAVFTLANLEPTEESTFAEQQLEIVMAGDTYRVD